jgi:hypothetical protein
LEGGFKLLFLKRKKLVIMLSGFFVVACACLAFFIFRSGSSRFEGVIVEEREELYWHEYEKDLFFPLPNEVPYLVKRLKVRTKNGKTLDLAVCPWEGEKPSAGMRIKGKFERKKEIEFGGLNFVLFWAGRNKIELHGAPDGVLREFRHLKKDSAPAAAIRKYEILPSRVR